ncbi:cilia- and flagella-associated protein 221-like isoform X2 [Physella acuta]|uniref:cilia- and flagella-associated protein 221-like isoform X2 n=1 Tax=Physella acuta TaxID=109671 RepID=UPI0027DB1F4C|nr:cilia- and flagella-associated protein 221-like isoform X2 [Physella acuta]
MPTGFDQQDRTVNGSISIESSATTAIEPELPESVSHSLSHHSINEKALFIENMQLVEPRKPIAVPNHLLETKIYATLGKNAQVIAKPIAIHFDGFEVGEKQTRTLALINASSELLRMHIIPPQTSHFKVKYTKPGKMVAGMSLTCTVEFTPDEWRYYYDCIRIHSPGEENLIIPIHGYPVMCTKDFPRKYNFPLVPVGHRLSKTFPLKSMVPVDFEFIFKYIQPHPAFIIEPMSGIVPANNEIEITVTFAPFEFQTALMTVELILSQFNSKGIICSFTGVSEPGLLKAKTMASLRSEVLDPRSVSPIEMARVKKTLTKKTIDSRQVLSAPAHVNLERNGIRFPARIDNPHAVAKILLQEPGKLKVNEIRQNVLDQKGPTQMTRQMKEAMFEQMVRKNVYDERQNQLRWQIKVGDTPISREEKLNILEERSEAINRYMLDIQGIPIPEEEFCRTQTFSRVYRIIRDVDSLAPIEAKFDCYSNDQWAVRFANLNKLVQAARKVVIQNRGESRLRGLRELVHTFSTTKPREATTDSAKLTEHEHRNEKEESHHLKAEKILRHKFPTFVSSTEKNDMAPDSVGLVQVDPTEIIIKREVEYFNLKVPLAYKLNDYNHLNVHDASSGYVPMKGLRKLRTGAEEEVITISEDSVDPCQEVVGQSRLSMADQVETGDLAPPAAMLKPMEYPALYIMNPSPGLQVFLAPMPYSEVDYDYHLCPLPRYPKTEQGGTKSVSTQKRFLDREDTIRGIMSWKKFPSQGLVSLTNAPTLTNVWVPRWDDSFNPDILPTELPPLMTELSPEELDNCVDEETEAALNLVPEMVSAKFPLVDINSMDPKAVDQFPQNNKLPPVNNAVGLHGPVQREKREEELELFMLRRYNKLRTKIQAKLEAISAKV